MTAAAGRAAVERALAVRVVHVHEVAATSEDAVELEAPEVAARIVADRVQQLLAMGVAATGIVRSSVGSHADVARVILDEVARTRPRAVVIGAARGSGFERLVVGDVVSAVRDSAGCDVYVVEPDGTRLSKV